MRRARRRRCEPCRTCSSAFRSGRPTTSSIPTSSFASGERCGTAAASELEIIRRRGNRNTLRGPDDSSVVADEHLARFLGGINQDTFETLFGIDHERLTQAGEEIRTGQGQLGELLFAAGAGLAGLSQAQKTLQEGLDELFKPRGQNPRINKALTELRDVQDELKRRQLSSEEWQTARPCLPRGRDRSGTDPRAGSQGPCRARAAEADQIGDPACGTPAPANQELDELGEVIRLRDDFGDEFRKAQDQLRLAEHTIDHVTRRARGNRRDIWPSSTHPVCCLTRRARSNRSRSDWVRWKKRARTAFDWRIFSMTPSTRRGGSSATWAARSIWMRPRRYGSGPMSRR